MREYESDRNKIIEEWYKQKNNQNIKSSKTKIKPTSLNYQSFFIMVHFNKCTYIYFLIYKKKSWSKMEEEIVFTQKFKAKMDGDGG